MVLLQANSLQQSSLSLSDGFELTNADLIIRNNRKAYGIVAMLFVTSVLLLISSLIYFNGFPTNFLKSLYNLEPPATTEIFVKQETAFANDSTDWDAGLEPFSESSQSPQAITPSHSPLSTPLSLDNITDGLVLVSGHVNNGSPTTLIEEAKDKKTNDYRASNSSRLAVNVTAPPISLSSTSPPATEVIKHFVWSQWSPWSSCRGPHATRRCHRSGSQTRTRKCLDADTLEAAPSEQCPKHRRDSEVRQCQCDRHQGRSRFCDSCRGDQLCLLRSKDSVKPECVRIKDRHDARGCGGLCGNRSEVCRYLGSQVYRCLPSPQEPCNSSEWQCNNSLCVAREKRCDGVIDCFDHSDEKNCNCNPKKQFSCDGDGDGELGPKMSCLPLKARCDGHIDCFNGFDERNCSRACPSGDSFTCNDGQCIRKEFLCDNFRDCDDGSDEPRGCSDVSCRDLSHRRACSNGRCILLSLWCNDIDNCGDNSDEDANFCSSLFLTL